MTNTQTKKDNEVNVENADVTQKVTETTEQATTSEYKDLLNEEDVKEIDNGVQEAEKTIDVSKAEYTKRLIEEQIIAEKKELKRIKAEREALENNSADVDVDEDKIATLIKKQLEAINTNKEADEVQNLISGIDDPYKRKIIEDEMRFIDKSLSPKQRLAIATRNADLQVKAKTIAPDVETKQGAGSPSSSYTRKDVNPNEDLIAKAYARAGLTR